MSLTDTSPTRRPAVLFALILLAWATSGPLPAAAQTSPEGEQTPVRLLAAAKSWSANDPYVLNGVFQSVDIRPFRVTVGGVGG